MIRGIGLIAFLGVFWWLLSFEPHVWYWGIFSVLLVAWLTIRMDIADEEGFPVAIIKSIFTYWPWLFVEIIKANIDVIKRLVKADPDISPVMFETQTSQKTDLGRAIYANSITLTPGTVTIRAYDDGSFLVHALSEDGRAGVDSLEMDKKVSAIDKEL